VAAVDQPQSQETETKSASSVKVPPDAGSDGGTCYFVEDFSGLPPSVWHSLMLAVITHPLPLQEFCPWQLLDADLHALWPLQEFPPRHFT